MKAKIALFCDIDPNAVVECRDASSLYEVPLNLREEGLDEIVVNHLKLPCAGYERVGRSGGACIQTGRPLRLRSLVNMSHCTMHTSVLLNPVSCRL